MLDNVLSHDLALKLGDLKALLLDQLDQLTVVALLLIMIVVSGLVCTHAPLLSLTTPVFLVC